jgi:hypothetical protein
MGFGQKKFTGYSQPNIDASLGLIVRLNLLWYKVDLNAEQANFDNWNILLDRIYCNLCYRDELTIVEDPVTKEITDIKLSQADDKEYKFITAKIFKSKIAYYKTPNTPKMATQKRINMSRWYRALMFKDVWLRKKMMTLKLYLKEIEHTPGSSLFGAG